MTFHADKVTDIALDDTGNEAVITGSVAVGFETVQLYVAGNLTGSQKAQAGLVTFIIPLPGSTDPIFLLSVDPQDVNVDFFSQAFPTAATSGNRIQVQVTTLESMGVSWKWRITLDSVQQFEALIFPAGDAIGGWGYVWGSNYGHGPFGAGWGNGWSLNWGHGGPLTLEWISKPLFNGTYALGVAFIDQAGNVSTTTTNNVTIESYARPASNLQVASYDLGTDTLSLTFDQSPDI